LFLPHIFIAKTTDWQKKTKMESKLHSSTTIDWNDFRDRAMPVCYSFDEATAIVRNDYIILDEWRGVRGSELLLF
jgi:hypothetical protein